MDAAATIARILTSTHAEQVLPRASYRAEYHRLVRVLHPDVCALPGAAEAVIRLNAYVAQLAALDTPTDDAGRLRVLPDHRVRFEGDPALLRRSVANHQRLLALRDPASTHFRQYLPVALAWEGPALLLTPPAWVVPLAGLVLPPEHVAWVLSRLLELTAWLHQRHFVHAGLVPEALALVPDTHGLVLLSAYHLTTLGGPLTTISGKYKPWYPDAVFADKRATPGLDLALVQRTAVALLGDASGHGVRLRGTVDERLLTFLLTPHHDAFAAFEQYRRLLRQLYPVPAFHPLIL
ncbi:MAG: hypothetical protein ACRYG7_18275 [Janthinobacterium lividum]